MRKNLTLLTRVDHPVEKHDGSVARAEFNTRVTRQSDKVHAVFVASSEIRSSRGRNVAPGSTSFFQTPQLVG